MKTAWLQHVPFEGPGLISEWMDKQGVEFPCIALWNNDPLPDPASLDFLVIMGGPMNVDETDQYPWLVEERAFICAAIDHGCAVLGICLGAQLIARTLGAKVHKGPAQEVGWYPIQKVVDHPLLADMPNPFMAYHWHGDTFDIPEGATRLVGSDLYPNQGFVYGDRVLAFQCHLETTPSSAMDIIEHTDFESTETIQSEQQMMGGTEYFNGLRPVMFSLLHRLNSQ